MLIVIAATFSYATLFSKALERDRMAAENLRLKEENKRIEVLAKEVEESRRSLDRIVRSLGGKLDLKTQSGQVSP